MKKILSIALIVAVVLSITVPFASAADKVSVQFYNYGGIVIPDINEIWDKEAYPYVLIRLMSSKIYVYFHDKPLYYDANKEDILTCKTDKTSLLRAELTYDEYNYILWGDVQWELTEYTRDPSYGLVTSIGDHLYWSNYDIKNDDTDEIFLSASAPVIDKVVEYNSKYMSFAPVYDYGGTLLPDLSYIGYYDLETYPYIVITGNEYLVRVYFFGAPVTITKEGSSYYLNVDAGSTYVICSGKFNEFLNGYTEYGSGTINTTSSGKLIQSGGVRWANFDFVDVDGTARPSVPPVLVSTFVGDGDSGNNDVSVSDYIYNVDAIVDHSTHWINALAAAITGTPFILAFVLVAFVGVSIRIICRLRK